MRKLIYSSLNLLILINMLPCLAMEKEKPLTDADKALLKAADENNCEGIIEALKNGANVNTQDQDKNTALHKAIQHGNYELFQALCNGKLNPCIVNKYDHYPIFYIDDKLDFLHQYNLIALTIDRAILDQISYKLKSDKKIKQKDVAPLKHRDELIILFNKTIGKKQKSFYCKFYCIFFYTIYDYILGALEDCSKKIVRTKDIDPALPFFDLTLAQKKASHLLHVLKIINTVAYITLNKPLTTVENGKPLTKDEEARAAFGLFGDLKSIPEMGLAGLYGLQLKNIVDNPTKYVEKIRQKLIIALKADELKQFGLKFVPVVTLLQNGAHFLNTPIDEQRMLFIVDDAPKSEIKPAEFALAFTSFARLRK